MCVGDQLIIGQNVNSRFRSLEVLLSDLDISARGFYIRLIDTDSLIFLAVFFFCLS